MPQMASKYLKAPWLRSGVLLTFGLVLCWVIGVVIRRDFDQFVNHGPLHDREPYWGELTLYALMVGVGGVAALCFAGGLTSLRRHASRGWLGLALPHSTPRGWMVTASVVAAAGAWAIGHWVTDFAWFTDDEQAYIYQAKLYGRGVLSGPVMEPALALRHPFVVPVLEKDGVPHWTGVYPVLQPFLMAMSAKLGNIHLSQFLCVAFVVYNTGRLAETLFGVAKVGVVAAWLTAFSPALLGLGATHHTSVLATALSVGAVRLLTHVSRTGSFLGSIGLGLVTGSIFLARPMEGTLCVLMFGGWLVVRAWRRARSNGFGAELAPLVGFGLGGLVPLAVFLSVNVAHTGKPNYSAYNILEQYIGGFFGFGDGKMWGRTHTPELAMRQTLGALVRMNAWLFGWPASLALWFVSLRADYRSPKTLLLMGMSVVQLCAYVPLAFGSVHDFGSAYHVWHLPWVASITSWVLHRMSQQAGTWNGFWRHFPVGLGAASMTLVGLLAFWPTQMQRWRTVSDVILGPVRAAKAAVGQNQAIVFWSSYMPPVPLRSWVHYGPSPDPGDAIIWARYYPHLLGEFRQRYPERRFYALNWGQTRPVVTSMDASVDAFLASLKQAEAAATAKTAEPAPPPPATTP